MKNSGISSKHPLLTILAFFICSFWSCQKHSLQPEPATKESFAPNFIPAKTSSELLALRKSSTANIIRTLADYKAIELKSPLAKLSTEQRLAFQNAINFEPQVSVVSLKYGDIQQALNEDDFATVLVMFGLDVKHGFWGFSKDSNIREILQVGDNTTNREAPPSDPNMPEPECNDYINAFCVGNNSCMYFPNYICMSGCNSRCR